MRHLKIEQTTSLIEISDKNVISKLYEIASSNELDATSDLKGNLQVTKAYKKHVDYLTQKFSQLQINVTQGLYISFEDSTIENLIKQYVGDGIGVMESDMRQQNSISFLVDAQDRDLVTSFDEFQYFTSITSLPNECFRGYGNMESIIIPSTVTSLQNATFSGCYKLQELDLSNVNLSSVNSSSGMGIFKDCTSLTKITLGNCGGFCTRWCMYDSQYRPTFINCTSLETIDVKSLGNVYSTMFVNCPNIKNFIIRSTTVPTIVDDATLTNTTFGSNATVFVPDEAVNDYKTAWSTIANQIKGLSEYVPTV